MPAVYNALRPVNRMTLDPWPRLRGIFDACMALPEVQGALPRNQPDYVELNVH